MEIGFSSYSGGDFLWFFGFLIAAAVVAGFWIPGALRPEGRLSQVNDAEKLAYLAGGRTRFGESVLANLFARGDLRTRKKTIIKSTHPQPETEAERAVLRVPGDFRWSDARKALDAHARDIDRDLAARGLLIAPDERLKFRLLPVLPYAVLLVIGTFRLQAGAAQGEPVGYLTLMLIAVTVLGFVRLAKFNPRTQAGDEALAEAQDHSSRLRSAPTRAETGMAVGLFGTAVLVGTPFESLHAMRQQGGGGYADGGGDGDGGGGCGGGGCGGCGG
ncbi:TIGR04222 domain-containing membrane protein [Aurantiacibacter hainanensis]|uniref:TIGR04222 domain-containing membrane protein n=1 Tax=Aurantiacibacter hainanensis TaxID=3076114 RepID=UPI0030C7434B